MATDCNIILQNVVPKSLPNGGNGGQKHTNPWKDCQQDKILQSPAAHIHTHSMRFLMRLY